MAGQVKTKCLTKAKVTVVHVITDKKERRKKTIQYSKWLVKLKQKLNLKTMLWWYMSLVARKKKKEIQYRKCLVKLKQTI